MCATQPFWDTKFSLIQTLVLILEVLQRVCFLEDGLLTLESFMLVLLLLSISLENKAILLQKGMCLCLGSELWVVTSWVFHVWCLWRWILCKPAQYSESLELVLLFCLSGSPVPQERTVSMLWEAFALYNLFKGRKIGRHTISSCHFLSSPGSSGRVGEKKVWREGHCFPSEATGSREVFVCTCTALAFLVVTFTLPGKLLLFNCLPLNSHIFVALKHLWIYRFSKSLKKF